MATATHDGDSANGALSQLEPWRLDVAGGARPAGGVKTSQHCPNPGTWLGNARVPGETEPGGPDRRVLARKHPAPLHRPQLHRSMLGAMTVRPRFVAIITCIALAGCGGSSRRPSTQATATPATSTQTTPGIGPARTWTFSGGGVSSTTTTTATSAPPEVPKAKKQRHHGETPAVSQGARVITSIDIRPAGGLQPPVISVPSGVGVEVQITNHGSATETVTLSVPSHPSVKVAPGAKATLQTGGLKDGTYRIVVNGTPRGQLMIGAQGGP